MTDSAIGYWMATSSHRWLLMTKNHAWALNCHHLASFHRVGGNDRCEHVDPLSTHVSHLKFTSCKLNLVKAITVIFTRHGAGLRHCSEWERSCNWSSRFLGWVTAAQACAASTVRFCSTPYRLVETVKGYGQSDTVTIPVKRLPQLIRGCIIQCLKYTRSEGVWKTIDDVRHGTVLNWTWCGNTNFEIF